MPGNARPGVSRGPERCRPARRHSRTSWSSAAPLVARGCAEPGDWHLPLAAARATEGAPIASDSPRWRRFRRRPSSIPERRALRRAKVGFQHACQMLAALTVGTTRYLRCVCHCKDPTGLGPHTLEMCLQNGTFRTKSRRVCGHSLPPERQTRPHRCADHRAVGFGVMATG
jgi:hypothetical protein